MQTERSVPGETRALLMDAAARVFVERGYHGATVRQIAEAAGFTSPVLYYHFGGKEELYVALVRDAFDGFRTLLEEGLRDAPDLTARLRAVAAAYLRFGREEPVRLRMLYAELFRPDGAGAELGFDAQRDWVEGRIDEVLRRGVREEGLRLPEGDVALARRLFVALLGGLLVQQAEAPERGVLEDEALDRIVVGTFLHGIRRAGRSGGGWDA